jgi:hypothetical protein
MLSPILLGLLSAFWLASGVHKFVTRSRFIQTINEYKWIPKINHRVIVSALIFVELSIAFLLLVPVFQLSALALACAALLVYTCLIWLNIIADNNVLDCGCLFGNKQQGLSFALLWRNLGILLLHVVAATTIQPNSPLSFVDIFTGLIFGGMVLLLSIITQKLMHNQSHIKIIKR